MQGPHRRRGVVWGGVYGGQTAVRTLRFLITTRIGTRRTEIMETIATGGIHPTLLGMRSVVCFCGDSGRGRRAQRLCQRSDLNRRPHAYEARALTS
jgi:hypothetical protein